MRCRVLVHGLLFSIVLSETVLAAEPVVVNPLSADDTVRFFHLPEGGAVMPFTWYNSLEVIDSRTGDATGQVFSERMHLYGFLEDSEHDLPVGFGVVPLEFLGDLPGLSINCAACHVGQMDVTTADGTTSLRVIGGPNVADVRLFSQDVFASIQATISNPFRMTALNSGQRMRTPRSRSRSTRPASGDRLLIDLYRNSKLLIAEAQYFSAQGRFPLSTPEGPGRLDSFATVRYLLFPNESRDFPFTAPTSVPHLWGIEHKQWLHWNSNTNSQQQRNIAQALGMGAVHTRDGIANVILENIDELERTAHRITPPAWPEDVLGPLDPIGVELGWSLYMDRCATCHNAGVVDAQTGLTTYPMFSLVEIGTDPNHAVNFSRPVGRRSFPEALQSRMESIERWNYSRRDPRNPVPVVQQIEFAGGEGRLPAVWRDPLASDDDRPVYAALPLTGVWATAPYLHNGSVPTLRDVLRPASQRPMQFRVGYRGFDPINVGYVQTGDNGTIPADQLFDTTLDGNSNLGHEGPDFGTAGLSETQIDALLEYLKSL